MSEWNTDISEMPKDGTEPPKKKHYCENEFLVSEKDFDGLFKVSIKNTVKHVDKCPICGEKG